MTYAEPDPTPSDVVPLSVAAKRLGVHPRTLSRLIAKGDLRGFTAPNPIGPRAHPKQVSACSMSEVAEVMSGHADSNADQEAENVDNNRAERLDFDSDGGTSSLGHGTTRPDNALPVPTALADGLSRELERIRQELAALRAEGKLAATLAAMEAQRTDRAATIRRDLFLALGVALVAFLGFGVYAVQTLGKTLGSRVDTPRQEPPARVGEAVPVSPATESRAAESR